MRRGSHSPLETSPAEITALAILCFLIIKRAEMARVGPLSVLRHASTPVHANGRAERSNVPSSRFRSVTGNRFDE